VETIKGIAENVAAFERRLQDAVESPIMDVMNAIGGIIRGFTSFLGRVTRGSVSE
jgi:phage-related protein